MNLQLWPKILLTICIIFSIDCVPNRNSAVSEIEPKGLNSEEKISHQIKSKNNIKYLKSLKGFRFGHLNIASLIKHVDELKVYLEREPLDVLSINETRLDGAIGTDIVSIPGYDMVSKNRNREGGGVAIYHRSILNIIDRDDLVPTNVEAFCLEIIKPKCKPILIAFIYRLPNSKIEFFDRLEVLFQNLDNEQKELIIVGDLNCDLLQRNFSNHTKRFNDIVNLFQLTQLIDHPTRITERTASLLDVAIVNNPEKISHSGVLQVGISDRSLIKKSPSVEMILNLWSQEIIKTTYSET